MPVFPSDVRAMLQDMSPVELESYRRRGLCGGQAMAMQGLQGLAGGGLGVQQAFDHRMAQQGLTQYEPIHRVYRPPQVEVPKTMHEELQHETNEWLKDIK